MKFYALIIGTIVFASLAMASSIVSPGGSPSGNGGDVQYNNAGAFAGSDNFQFNGTSVTANCNIGFLGTSSHGIVGTTTNDSAASGNVGEYVESIFSNVSSPTSGTYGDATSISLTAGDWDVSLVMSGLPGGTWATFIIGISTTSGNSATGLVEGSNQVLDGNSTISNGRYPLTIPSYRMALSATSTVYAKVQNVFGTSMSDSGRLSARRRR